MLIDCDACVMRHTDACADCVVTALLDPPDGAVVFDLEAARALRALADEGLVPRSRFSPSAPDAARSG